MKKPAVTSSLAEDMKALGLQPSGGMSTLAEGARAQQRRQQILDEQSRSGQPTGKAEGIKPLDDIGAFGARGLALAGIGSAPRGKVTEDVDPDAARKPGEPEEPAGEGEGEGEELSEFKIMKQKVGGAARKARKKNKKRYKKNKAKIKRMARKHRKSATGKRAAKKLGRVKARLAKAAGGFAKLAKKLKGRRISVNSDIWDGRCDLDAIAENLDHLNESLHLAEDVDAELTEDEVYAAMAGELVEMTIEMADAYAYLAEVTDGEEQDKMILVGMELVRIGNDCNEQLAGEIKVDAILEALGEVVDASDFLLEMQDDDDDDDDDESDDDDEADDDDDE